MHQVLKYFCFLPLLPSIIAAQTGSPCSHCSLDFPVSGYGLSFGNSARHSGIRFNWSDDCLEEVNGLNFTIWVPGERMTGTMNGFAFGLG
ncbi:MAG TPA: hypothetical protein VF514_02975, partial [Bacteroidota bacterium]